MSDDDDAEISAIINTVKKKKAKKVADPNLPKRSPGRPPKYEDKPEDIKGVVNTPEFKDSIFEVSYSKPAFVKNIGEAIKKLSIPGVNFTVKNDAAYIYGEHEFKRQLMLITFNGRQIQHFYTNNAEHSIGVNSSALLAVLPKIHKNYNRIVFRISKNETDRLILTLLNDSIGNLHNYRIKIQNTYPVLTEELQNMFDFSDYTITMKYPVFDFKKLADSMASLAHKTHIIQTYGSPPVFQYNQKDNVIQCESTSSDNGEKIDLMSKLEENQVFTLTIDTTTLAQAASIDMTSQTYQIRLREGRMLNIIHYLHKGAITVSTLSQLSNANDEDDDNSGDKVNYISYDDNDGDENINDSIYVYNNSDDNGDTNDAENADSEVEEKTKKKPGRGRPAKKKEMKKKIIPPAKKKKADSDDESEINNVKKKSSKKNVIYHEDDSDYDADTTEGQNTVKNENTVVVNRINHEDILKDLFEDS
jgi:hypothetical protein